jgi:hypothetical protein
MSTEVSSHTASWSKGGSRRNKIIALSAAVLIATILYTLIVSRAASNFVSINPSAVTVSGNAQLVTEADGAKSLLFSAPVTPPPTTPPPTTPPVSGWPSASNVGLKVATARTMAGASIDDTTWFKQNNFPGTGTQSDPFVVDRVLFTDVVHMGRSSNGDLKGKWVKFSNCRFYGNPGNPTPGQSAGLFASDYAAFFIMEDSTVGPNLPILASGSTSSGTNFGIFSYVPFIAKRNNIYGANILVGFETERSETTGVLVEDNYIHDVFSASGDHTDVINGNSHASHVVIRHNYLDGVRTGNSYVANVLGVYDDQCEGCPASAGIIENWTIDKNYIDRGATLFLSNTSKSRFLDPFIVTNNTWGRYSTNLFAGRTPSVQSGNVDQNGKPLTF